MTDKNPLSPHIQIYNWHVSSLVSISHRITGVIKLLTLTLVFFLVVYHILCHFIYLQQQKNINRYSSGSLRLWNEIATVFLVSIVFVIVLKNQLDWIYGTIGFFLFSFFLFGAVQLYKKLR